MGETSGRERKEEQREEENWVREEKIGEKREGDCLIRLRASHHALPQLQSQVILQEAPGVGESRDRWGAKGLPVQGYTSDRLPLSAWAKSS